MSSRAKGNTKALSKLGLDTESLIMMILNNNQGSLNLSEYKLFWDGFYPPSSVAASSNATHCVRHLVNLLYEIFAEGKQTSS